jgi:hypothetical protein
LINFLIFALRLKELSCHKGRINHRLEREKISTVSVKEWHPPMAAEYWQQEEQKAVIN